MNTKTSPVTLSERALFARVSRALWRRERLILRRCDERSQWFGDLGRYYCTNENMHIAGPHIGDLEETARGLRVLQPHESLAE